VRELGLARSRLAFEKERTIEPQREEHDGRKAVVREVPRFEEGSPRTSSGDVSLATSASVSVLNARQTRARDV